MITINLLPPSQKQDISFEKSNFSIVLSFVFLFIALILTSISLYIINNSQKNSLKSLETQTDIVKQYLSKPDIIETENKINKINQYLAEINKIQTNKTSFSKTLIEISQTTPGNIRLFSIKMDKTAKTIEIQGNAKTREDLIKFTENLKKSSFFEKIESPLSNISTPSNIDFNIAGNLSDKAIK